jgi:hypothetical protein
VSRQFYDLDAILEFDALDDFRQLVFTLLRLDFEQALWTSRWR